MLTHELHRRPKIASDSGDLAAKFGSRGRERARGVRLVRDDQYPWGIAGERCPISTGGAEARA